MAPPSAYPSPILLGLSNQSEMARAVKALLARVPALPPPISLCRVRLHQEDSC